MSATQPLDDRVETMEFTLFGNARAKQPGLVDVVSAHELEISEWKFYKRFARTVAAMMGVTSISSVIILIITVYNFLRSLKVVP